MNKLSLIGVFWNSNKFPRLLLKEIAEQFEPQNIFIFKLEEEPDKILVTFNISESFKNQLDNFREKFKNIVRLHRFKPTNTLYTINSLNKIIEEQNGKVDRDFKVDWTAFSNKCVLLDRDKKLRTLSTNLYDVVKVF